MQHVFYFLIMMKGIQNTILGVIYSKYKLACNEYRAATFQKTLSHFQFISLSFVMKMNSTVSSPPFLLSSVWTFSRTEADAAAGL